jgi:hypothetical protein
VFLWIEERRQTIEPLVGHARDTDVGVLSSSGAGGFTCAREQLEKSRLADGGKPDQTRA